MNILSRTKLFYRIFRNNLSNIAFKAGETGFTFWRLLLIIFLILISLTLVSNIYSSIVDARTNLFVLEEEQSKLDELKIVEQNINNQLEYYSSLEFRQRYAYESLNLAKQDERIYLIPLEERREYEPEAENRDPVKLEDNSFWWNLLRKILGSAEVK